MLLLVTILLVVVGTISLVIGFIQSSLVPIYISIACSVLAAVVLLIFSRMTAKSQQVVTSGAGPAPLDHGDDRGAPQPAFTGTGLLGESADDDDDTYQPVDRYGSTSRYGSVEADPVLEDDHQDVVDDDFPIERYDSRRVGEILPLLAELDLDELDIVREHEEQGKSRATVLARIDQLIDQLEAEDRQEAASRFDDTEAVPVAVGGGGARDGAEDDEPLGYEPPPPPPPPVTQSVTVAALPEDDGYFPIEDYDDLRASEILPLLPELDDDELEMVQERESNGAARSSILRRIEALLGAPAAAGAGTGSDGFDDAPPPPVSVPSADADADADADPDALPMPVFGEPAPAAKAPAKRAPAKRAPAKKVPAAAKVVVASAAPPAKKVAAKKATVTKAAPLSTKAVKRAPSATEAPVKKAAARGGATKATVAKKAPAAKATTAKATTKAAASKATAAKSSTAASKAVKASKATKK